MMPPKIGHIFNTTMKLKWAQHTGKKDHLSPKKYQSLRFSLLHSVHVSVSQRIYVSELRVCISQNICHLCIGVCVLQSFRVTESQRLRFLLTVVFMSFQAQESKGLSSVSQRLKVIVFQSLNISTQYKVSAMADLWSLGFTVQCHVWFRVRISVSQTFWAKKLDLPQCAQ